ncbi:Choline dehydrogenase [Cnuella takakiae]|uniref:Choline dehydrogenase n=2 Tax=Cnuella takakiae TaxID=1302690 RepID=A0A1M5DXH8_9BACT|nr:GMC family oxidoreductase [Cnuella takakiae]SHF71707.1 Choline dehydrogenase [Cnuella takakiae]
MSRFAQEYDAIVIGSGMTGGWAAKELTERGLKTLMIESGRNVDHIKDYPTTNMMPWEFAHRGTVPQELRDQYPSTNTHYIFSESTLHFLKKDAEQEYIQDRPFSWVRGDQVGGRSLLWARATQRWSDYDFGGPLRDGYAVDWPIRYKDIALWYSHVERFIGVSGNRDGLASLPDGEFLPPFDLTCAEKHFQGKVKAAYKDRHIITGRVANISEAKDIHYQQGRATCQRRTICERGCPFGGYFSSNASTIPWAKKTGKFTLLTDSIVHSVIYDEQKQRAVGVRVIDKKTGNITEYGARLVSVNASAMNSNLVLLNSTSNRFPNGLGNDNGLMGTHIAFHSFRGRVMADYDGLKDFTTDGRRPTSGYMPRFRNLLKQEADFLRGYSASIHSDRSHTLYGDDFGESLKRNIMSKDLGPWQISAQMMGETIPKATSTLRLDPDKKDKYGMPQLRFSVGYDDNDDKMQQDFYTELSAMFEKAGFKNIRTGDTNRKPGNENHEMGGVRMGHDPKTSLLNRWNQLHLCKNVLVTDGACMVSTSTQNPSLTYMALTARAVDHAVAELKKGSI